MRNVLFGLCSVLLEEFEYLFRRRGLMERESVDDVPSSLGRSDDIKDGQSLKMV